VLRYLSLMYSVYRCRAGATLVSRIRRL